MKVITLIGTRPEIIRLSEVIKELDRTMTHVLVHTGQNYDYELNEVFFKELELRKPDHFLDAAGENGTKTVANTLSKFDDVLAKESPDAVLILGDTNSAIGVYAAKRRKIPVFHMEAGNRCFDERVPEEINRRMIDHISDINLVYSERARENLVREGVAPQRIIKTGSPMFEVLEHNKQKIAASNVLESLKLKQGGYFVASFHREENVSDEKKLSSFVEALVELHKRYNVPVIVSTHPRTKARLDALGVKGDGLLFHKPLGFFDYVKLQQNAMCTLSDSGTISEEASILQFPAVTMREAHERLEGMDETAVIMSGLSAAQIVEATVLAMSYTYSEKGDFRIVEEYAIPNVSKKMARIIMSYVSYVRGSVWKEDGSRA